MVRGGGHSFLFLQRPRSIFNDHLFIKFESLLKSCLLIAQRNSHVITISKAATNIQSISSNVYLQLLLSRGVI